MAKPRVVPGQVWRDCDARMRTRSLLTVVAVEGDKAILRDVSGRVTRVSVARMRPTSTGFELVKDAPAENKLEPMRDDVFEYLRDEMRAVVEGRQESIHLDWRQAGHLLAVHDRLVEAVKAHLENR